MSSLVPFYSLATLLIVLGALVPSVVLVESIRTIPKGLQNQLLLGGDFFRIGLVIWGLFLLGSKIVWQSDVLVKVSAPTSSRGSEGTSLALVVIVALIMRLYNLEIGIWFDEIVTYVSYMNLSFGEILTTYDNQNNHLLYTLSARLSLLSFGDNVWSLRLPAVLFGVGSIWALYCFATEVGTRVEALLSSTLLTFSYHHVWFSQNARGYSALLFWTILSSWLLLRALRESKHTLWILHGCSLALGMFTHVTMAFVVIAHGAVYLFMIYDAPPENRRTTCLRGLLGFAVAGLLTFQLYALVLPQMFSWQGSGVSSWQGKVAVIPWKSPIWMVTELLSIFNIGPGGGVLLMLSLIVFGIGTIDFAYKKSPVILLLLVSVLVGITVIMVLRSTLVPRFFFFAAGFAVVVLVHGVMLCGTFLSRGLHFDLAKAPLIGASLCACVIAISGTSVPRAYQPKQDYGAALEFVQQQRQPGDAILTVGLTVLPYERFYKIDWGQVNTVEELDKARSTARRTWLVYTMPVVLQASNPGILERIQNDFDAIREFPGTLNGGSVMVAIAKS